MSVLANSLECVSDNADEPVVEVEDFFEQDGPGLFDAGVSAPESDVATVQPVSGETVGNAVAEAVLAQNTAVTTEDIDSVELLALYRRYRPDTFEQVIGQEHVTIPLQRALANNRVSHAYLFSGPRGCGKTTSARILARCLNCEQGPTPTPCGTCTSCRELATGGPGSIDVIEIDAASHGRVDDARELRDGIYFAPVQSRYKIYIIDEAHMVTKEGFNALLKVVEEPPAHVKFIFATTEPDKVIGTIRSRTHHYPFRLVPPKVLVSYLEEICAQENVQVEPGVLPLVVRAGAGSVRDSLSVLDQLLGAAETQGVSYQQAAALLGYTPDALLDEMADALAAGDGKGVFSTIDKVIEIGQDPRRFAEDLLQRLRDLMIIAEVPDALSSGLIDVAGDQGERLRNQAAGIGAGELTRAAEVIATGLVQMRGTTAPRLNLELMCARMLLPGADTDGRGTHARLDRVERRMGMANATGQPNQGRQPAQQPVAGQAVPRQENAVRNNPPVQQPKNDSQIVAPQATEQQVQPEPRQEQQMQRPAQVSTQPAEEAGVPGMLNTAEMRRLWPDVLTAVKSHKRFTWILLSQNAQVLDASQKGLVLAFNSAGARDSFTNGQSVEVLKSAMMDVLGVDIPVQCVIEGEAALQNISGAPVATQRPAQQRPAEAPVSQVPQPMPAPERQRSHEIPDAPAEQVSEKTEENMAGQAEANTSDEVVSTEQADAEKPAEKSTKQAGKPVHEIVSHEIEDVGEPEDPDADVSMSDPTIDESGQSAIELLTAELGAELIEQVEHE